MPSNFKFLMCPPDFFELAYEINPWMSVKRAINVNLARIQWDLLYKLLTDQLGVDVDLIRPVKGLPDMVFTANAGIVRGKNFVRSNFRHKERQPEALFFEEWFKERDYRIQTIPKVYHFEGEGDALSVGNKLFCGYHFRSDVQAHAELTQHCAQEVISLQLIDDRFYHLDTCFCPIGEDTVLYCPQAFEAEGIKDIKAEVKRLIAITLGEALKFVCNSIVIGKKVILPVKSKKTSDLLRLLGYQVYEVDLSEFMKAGGSAKCLVLNLSHN